MTSHTPQGDLYFHRAMPPSFSNDDEAPDDEQSHHLSVSSDSSNPIIAPNHRGGTSSLTQTVEDDGIDRIGGKKKLVQDRPWKKLNEYETIHQQTSGELDIFGISSTNIFSPTSIIPVAPPTDATSAASRTELMNKKSIMNDSLEEEDDDLSYDDVTSSRWANERTSPLEAKAATVNAVGLAAARLADEMDDFGDNVSVPSVNNNSNAHPLQEEEEFMEAATPRKENDHERVRLEALHLLNLATNSSKTTSASIGGNRSGVGSFSGSGSKRNNRVQTALQGLSGGIGFDQRRKYERFTPDKMQFDTQDNINVNTMEDMEYGQSPSPKKKGGTWGSRYSVEPQVMALYGGMSSKQVLSNLEREHYDNMNQNVSARNMFKSSPHECEDRWNISSGARSVPLNQTRMWNTWIAVMRESISNIMTKVSSMNHGNSSTNSHTTIGSHRNADHSSSPRSIFTGMAVTQFLDKISPRSRSLAWNNFAPDDVNFNAADDYIYDRRLRRKKYISMLMLMLISMTAIIGLAVGISRRGNSGVVGTLYYDVGETVKFYVTSDVPYNTADEVKLTRDLADLHSRNGDFLVHLGDVGDASVNMCTISVYEDAADLLKQSPIPVFVLPGDNDWNNCPSPKTALRYWMDSLNRFEDNFDKNDHSNFPTVKRQLARSENFSFLHKGVLFLGFHLVDGRVQSEKEWSLRIAEDVAWMDEEFNTHEVDEYRAIVIFAHAAPTTKVSDFVWPMKDSLSKLKKPVIYLHANDGDGMLQYNPFSDLPNLTVVRMEKGYKSPPIQITIESGPHPFKFSNIA